jgi:hypothetical protein
VPSAQEMTRLLELAGGSARPEDLTLTREEVLQSLEYAHFFRNRFTVRKLGRILGFSLTTI